MKQNRTSSPKTLTPEEVQALLTFLQSKVQTYAQRVKSLRNYTIAMLMLEAGLRVSEVVQLSTGDLFWNKEPVKSIIIRPMIAKNKREREIPVSQALEGALKKLQELYTPPFTENKNNLAFRSPRTGKTLTRRQVHRIISTAGRISFGRDIHPHMLRHTFATRLMRVTDIRTVQELLGHTSITSTQIYTHPDSKDLKTAIDSMEKTKSI